MCAGVMAVAMGTSAFAQVPQLITYQGRLSESTGAPISGAHTIIFRLYNAEQGGTKLWEETHTVTVPKEDNGIFSVVLGSLVPLSELNFNQPLWLTMAVDGDSEMTPRQRVTSASYAINADTLDGLDSQQFVRGDTASTVTGELTLSRSGRALLLKPSADPSASTTLLEVKNASGTSTFSVDLEGDVAMAGNLTVTGTITGASLTGGTVTSVDSGAGLTGGPVTTSGTLSVGAGSGIQVNADDVAVKLASGPGLAVDANGLSLLRSCSNGQLLKWNTTTSTWACQDDADTNAGGDITGVTAGAGLTGGGTSGTVTLSVDVGTSANQIVQLDANAKLPAVDGSALTNLSVESAEITDGTITAADTADAFLVAGSGATVTKGANAWTISATSIGGDITGVTAGAGLSGGGSSGDVTVSLATPVSVANGGTGLSSLTAGDILYASAANTLSALSVGAEGKVLKIAGGLPTWGTENAGSGTVTSVDSGAGLSGGPITGSGTLAVGAGNGIAVSENDVAVDVMTTESTATTSSNAGLEASANGLRLLGGCSDGQVLKWNTATSVWACQDDIDTNPGGDITGVTAGAGLSGGGATGEVTLNIGSGTGMIVSGDSIAVNVGTAANQIVQLDATAKLPAVDGSAVTGLNASNLSSGTVPDARLSGNVSLLGAAIDSADLTDGTIVADDTATTFLQAGSGVSISKGTASWTIAATGSGDITGVAAGTGLSGGGTSGDVTLSLAAPVAVTNGGTGASSFTAGGILLGQGTSAVTTTGVLAKGSLIVGDGAADPTALSVGSDNALLVADAAQSSGVRWATGCLPFGGASSSSHAADFEMGVGGGSDTNGRLDDAWPAPVAATISSFRASVRQAPGSGDSWTATLRKNNADTSLSCAISGASATSCSDTGTVTVAAGDRLGVAFGEGGSASGTTGSGWSACFVPD